MSTRRKIITPALAAALETFRAARKKMLASGLPLEEEKSKTASQQLARPKGGGGTGAQGGNLVEGKD